MDSFISWIGGKKRLRNRIIEQFPADFGRYIEVFGGAGWILFSKDKHAPMEVFNDVNGDLINLYRCVKYHPEALQKELEWLGISREQFFDAKAQVSARGLTDIQRAAIYFAMIKLSFGTDLKSFGVRPRDMQSTIDYLQEAAKRLNRVVIENVDFEQLIKTYDRPEALFYLDPPYYNAEKYYPDRFNPDDHQRLRNVLGSIKGKFLLSYNDCLEIKKMYEGFEIMEEERQHNLTAKTGSRKYAELIIKNY